MRSKSLSFHRFLFVLVVSAFGKTVLADSLVIDPWENGRGNRYDREPQTWVSRGPEIIGRVRTAQVSESTALEINRASVGGRVTVNTSPNTEGLVTFWWDSDASSSLQSSAGLGCVDLTIGNGHFFTLKDVVVVRLPNSVSENRAKPIEVQIQIWSGRDATGQRYSRAYVKRVKLMPIRDLIIPFSLLSSHGPHGTWDPKCVGAIRLSIHIPQSTVRSVVSFGTFEVPGQFLKAAEPTPSARLIPDPPSLPEAGEVTPTVTPTPSKKTSAKTVAKAAATIAEPSATKASPIAASSPEEKVRSMGVLGSFTH